MIKHAFHPKPVEKSAISFASKFQLNMFLKLFNTVCEGFSLLSSEKNPLLDSCHASIIFLNEVVGDRR